MGKALGKGLDALLSSLEVDEQEKVEEIPLKEIRPNPYQPRRIFDEKAIEELKQSIIEHGVLQPIILRKTIRGYEIVVGERRFRAAKAANLEKIPAVVRNINEQEMMELALLENLQREDLTPIEEGRAYQMIMDRLNITQEELSKRIGKSRPHIANHVRLLSLPPQIQQMINENQLSMGHGRALLGLKQKEKMKSLAEKTIKEQLNVRQLEQLVQQWNQNVSRGTKRKKEKRDIFIVEQEMALRERFGTTVKIKTNNNKGRIEIEFYSKNDLNRLLELLYGEPAQ